MGITFRILMGSAIVACALSCKKDDVSVHTTPDEIILTNTDHIESKRKSDFPGGVVYYRDVCITINNKGYYLAQGAAKDFWQYDPLVNKWTQEASYKGSAERMVYGFSIGSKGYIGGGTNDKSVLYNDFWEYDPTANDWTSKAGLDLNHSDTGSGFSIGDLGYVSSYDTSFWAYSPALNKWTKKARVKDLQRYNGIAFSNGTKGYVGFGFFNGRLQDVIEYNTANDKWTSKGIFAQLGDSGTVIYLGISHGEALVVDSKNSIWGYNLTSGTWKKRADTGDFGNGFTIADKVYAFSSSGQLYELVITE